MIKAKTNKQVAMAFLNPEKITVKDVSTNTSGFTIMIFHCFKN